MKKYLLLTLFLSNSIAASSWTGWRDVEEVSIRADSAPAIVFLLSGDFHNPDNCRITDSYYVRSTNAMYREIFSLLLAAKKSNSQVRIKVEGCEANRPGVVWIKEK